MSSAGPQDFGVLLNLAFSAFKDALDADLAAAGFADIGPSFGDVYRLLADGPCTLTELAKQLAMTPPGAQKVVNDMVAKGYVSRSGDAADRRVRRLQLTARGRKALARARQFHALYERALAEQLGARTAAAARRALESMAAAGSEHGRRRPRPA